MGQIKSKQNTTKQVQLQQNSSAFSKSVSMFTLFTFTVISLMTNSLNHLTNISHISLINVYLRVH